MDEEQHMDRFDMENDFEGGHWVGGEFYFSKKRDKKKQTKDDVLYGVFQETDSDSDGGRKRRRKDRGLISKGDLTKPLDFVSGGTVVQTTDDEDVEKEERAGLGSGAPANGTDQKGDADRKASNSDDELLPTAFGQRVKEAAKRREEKAKMEKKGKDGKPVAVPVAPGVGEFEKHTRGIGMKLLMQMGFSGRLGKEGQGIAVPIEQKLRPKSMGMGYNDYKEKSTSLPPPPGKGQEEEAGPQPDKLKEGAKSEKAWKKKNVGLRKKEYKTAAKLIEELQHIAPGGTVAALAEPQKVLDMRGPQVRVLTNLDRINDEQKAMEDDTPMPELQHNLRLIVDLAEAEIQTCDRRLRHERDSIAIIEREQERLLREVEHYRVQSEALGQAFLALEDLEERATTAASGGGPPLALEVVADVFENLRQNHRAEYQLFNLPAIALSHVLPLLAARFRGWNPLQAPRQGVEEIRPWKPLLSGSDKDQPRDYSIFTDMEVDADSYTSLFREVILPPLRSAVANFWEPRDPEPLLGFMEAWEDLLPAAVRANLLEQLVMPKLAAAVDTWDPRLETVPIHAWLHPWLPLLGSRMEPLYPPIRFKLSSALTAWHPSDASAYALLSPWQNVFDAQSWEQMILRSIMPKLAAVLQHELVINPQAQVLEPFHWVLAWASAAPAVHMVSLLEAHFFPKWHQVLYHWLASAVMPNFDEVTRWYLGWKGLFPAELLSNPRMQRQLNIALDMMNQAVEGAPVLQPGTRENMTYLRVTEQRQFNQQQQQQYASQPPLPTAPPPPLPQGGCETTTYGAASLKEIVEGYAQQNDVEFLPKIGRVYEGLPVFGFGSVSVAVDTAKQMLYAQPVGAGAGDRWAPVGLEQLLELHRSRVAAGGTTSRRR